MDENLDDWGRCFDRGWKVDCIDMILILFDDVCYFFYYFLDWE